MTPIDLNAFPGGGLLGVAAGVAGSFLCFLVLRLDFARAKRNQMQVLAALEADLRRELSECRVECQSLKEAIPAPGVPAPESLRPARSQAMQLLRSGMSPEAAAKKLDLPVREVRLIAKVARTLSSVPSSEK